MNGYSVPSVAAALLLCAGCASTPSILYSWGQYEELIYTSYASPGKLPPEAQAAQMEQDYEKARAKNKRMPPGWHAQLGYLYFQLGKADEAKRSFLTEKAEFPESTVLMDQFLSRLEKS